MQALWMQKCPVSLNTELRGQNCA